MADAPDDPASCLYTNTHTRIFLFIYFSQLEKTKIFMLPFSLVAAGVVLKPVRHKEPTWN